MATSKNPFKIKTVYSLVGGGFGITTVGGRRYKLNPSVLGGVLPKPGQEIELARHEWLGETTVTRRKQLHG